MIKTVNKLLSNSKECLLVFGSKFNIETAHNVGMTYVECNLEFTERATLYSCGADVINVIIDSPVVLVDLFE